MISDGFVFWIFHSAPLVEVNAVMSFKLCNQLRAVQRNSNAETSRSVSEPPRLCVSHPSLYLQTLHHHHHHYDLPSVRNHISKLFVPLQAIRRQVTSAPTAGSCFSVPWYEFRAGFSKRGIMSTSADTDTKQLAPSANLLHGDEWKKNEGNFNFIWKVF